MTIDEAIKGLDIIRFNPHWDELVKEEHWQELMEMSMNVLEEAQRYRAIGTPEECQAAVERNNEKNRIIDGVTECCGYYFGTDVFQRELLNPAPFAVGKLKGAMKNEIICGKCGCAGPYVKIKEFPNKMDAQGKAKEAWNRRASDEKTD